MATPKKDRTRICAECQHFYFYSGSPRYSEWTPGWEASIECTKLVWGRMRLSEFDSRAEFAALIRTAATCDKYTQADDGGLELDPDR